MEKKVMSLDGVWMLSVLGENVYHISEEEIPAAVPGTVYTTLVKEGKMPDPFYRMNELDATKLMENRFRYRTRFLLTEEMTACDRLYLEFQGIDTLAEVFLNGISLGRTANMHRTYTYEVGRLVTSGENELVVMIESPIKYIKEQNKLCYAGGSTDAMEGYPHIRKAHCMFGWDWGPRLPDAGIFRPVRLYACSKGRLTNCYIRQQHEEESVELFISSETEAYGNEKLHTEIMVTAPDGMVFHAIEGQNIKIYRPRLWWPKGYGSQSLYEVTVQLYTADHSLIEEIHKKIGLRRIKIERHKDQWGESFYHEVNGVGIFAMGADYIPEDSLLGRRSYERTRRLLMRAKQMNANCIRVWGGGFYPDDYFYDLCDEMGLLVWQDFMFACSNYELTEEFEQNITVEIRQNIERIRHHACLALYCGNNEMEMQTLGKVFHPSKKQFYDYIKIFEFIIPKLVRQYDPEAWYWPSSPSSGGNYDEPNDETRGDVHYWDVWHGEKPITEYRKHYFRYVSEFGFQSFPSIKTIATFTKEEDRNIFSRVMEMHQRNRAANGKILKYLAQTYLYPSSFTHLIYASQMLQMEAIRCGVEHWRRNRGRCMGAIVWQLNDIWPVASWSGIDYYGRLKASYYGVKRCFAPVMISAEERGEINGRDTCIEEVKEYEKSIRLCVANETLHMVEGVAEWELRSSKGRIRKKGSYPVTVDALASKWLPKVEFPDCDVQREYVTYRFLQQDTVISEGSVLFTAPKHFEFQDPMLRIERSGDTIYVYSESFAKGVEIDSTDGDLYISDNYFDMNPGVKKVSVLEGKAENLVVTSVYDIDK